MIAFLHGFILALGLILPLGPQNIFVFNQGALQKRLAHAMPVVVAASLCDTLLIGLSVLGISVVVLTLTWLKTAIFIVGFIFLIFIGKETWKSEPPTKTGGGETSPLKQILFAVSVSLLNPHAILDTVGVIGTGSLAYTGNELMAYTLACICVSWVWFIGLAIAGRMLGKVDSEGHWIVRLNKISAIIIWCVAAYFALQIYHSFT